MTALDRDGRQQPAVVTQTDAGRCRADARPRPRRGHPDRLGSRHRPGAAMRLLLARRVLPELLDGPMPDRPVRRRTAGRRLRRDRGPDRRPQPRPRHRRRIRRRTRTTAATSSRSSRRPPRARHPATGSPTRPSSAGWPRSGTIETGDRPVDEIAHDLATAMYEDFGSRKTELGFVQRAPDQRRALWKRLGPDAARDRPRERRDAAPHPHGRRQRLRQRPAPRPAHGPGRRLGRLDDRDRAVGRHVRHPEPGHVTGQPRDAQGRPGQHRAPRAQPAAVRRDRPGRRRIRSWSPSHARRGPPASTSSACAAPATSC